MCEGAGLWVGTRARLALAVRRRRQLVRAPVRTHTARTHTHLDGLPRHDGGSHHVCAHHLHPLGGGAAEERAPRTPVLHRGAVDQHVHAAPRPALGHDARQHGHLCLLRAGVRGEAGVSSARGGAVGSGRACPPPAPPHPPPARLCEVAHHWQELFWWHALFIHHRLLQPLQRVLAARHRHHPHAHRGEGHSHGRADARPCPSDQRHLPLQQLQLGVAPRGALLLLLLARAHLLLWHGCCNRGGNLRSGRGGGGRHAARSCSAPQLGAR